MTRTGAGRARLGLLMAGPGLLLLAACGAAAPQPHQPPAAVVNATRTAQANPQRHTGTAGAARRPAQGTWWQPSPAGPDNGPEFQWELDHPLNAGKLRSTGGRSPTLFDIDGILNSAATVAALHQRGDKVICYIEVGSAGNYYPAAAEGIAVSYYDQLKAAGDLGASMPGYSELYLNINAPSTMSIIKSMIRRQCAAKGFDAVEPDIDDSYTDRTGFPITEAANETYDRRLAAYAHHLGLAWGQKNGDNDAAFSATLEPFSDFLLTEECQYYRTCGIVTPPYVRAGKLVLDAEYTADWGGMASALSRFCPADIAGGLDGTLFTPALTGRRHPCR